MIERHSVTIPSVTVDTTAAASEEIRIGCYSGGYVIIPTTLGASVTSLTWYVAEKAGGTYVAAYDEDGTAITQTVSHTKAYAIPSALFGAVAVKIVTNAAGTLAVTLKA